MKKIIYLDHAAATPLDYRVKKAMDSAQEEYWANASSVYSLGRKAKQALEDSRKQIANILGAKPAEIVFTSGSTEAINMAIFGVARMYPRARVVASAIEHEAVRECLVALEKEGHFTNHIPVDDDGIVDPESVVAAVDDMTALVCIMYVNNEIGTVQPMVKISKKIAEIRADRVRRGVKMPLYWFCDAAQAGLLTLAVNRLGIDMMSMGGSKLYGPRGCGFIYIRSGAKLETLIHGGHQERGLRSGTQNVTAAVGMALALQLVQKDRAKENQRQLALRDELWNIIYQKLPESRINGSLKARVGMNLNVLVPGVDGENLVEYLNVEGICVATGSACIATSQSPSKVLTAIGLSDEQARSSVRISLGLGTTKAEVRHCAKALVEAVEKLKVNKK